jgi:preprotein translocase subunit SecA
MRAQVQLEPAPPPELPDFITQHLDPFSADDDTADIDAAARGLMPGVTPLLNIPQPPLPLRDDGGNVAEAPISRNAPCPCGSGKKYKHCHGQLG